MKTLGRCPKPRLEPSFGEGSKDSQNSPEKGVPLSCGAKKFDRQEERGSPFSGEFFEFLKSSPKEGFKQALDSVPRSSIICNKKATATFPVR